METVYEKTTLSFNEGRETNVLWTRLPLILRIVSGAAAVERSVAYHIP
jgi:hypothetical protein